MVYQCCCFIGPSSWLCHMLMKVKGQKRIQVLFLLCTAAITQINIHIPGDDDKTVPSGCQMAQDVFEFL